MSGPPAFEGGDQPRFNDETQRVLSRRTRELQAEAGVTSFWTPSSMKGPASLGRAASPTDERKPGDERSSPALSAIGTESPYRRARAGTLPSSFGATPGGSIEARSAGPSPAVLSFSPSPFRQGAISPLRSKNSLLALPEGVAKDPVSTTTPGTRVVSPATSRLRGNSLTLPHSKNPYSNAFGPSIFDNAWAGRGTGASQNASPAASTSFSRDDEQTPIKTLDYLGLADTPTPPRAMAPTVPVYGATLPFLTESATRRDANRVRSYSVNNKEKYEDYDEEYTDSQQSYYQDIYRSTPARPRSRTAGILESPPALRSRNYTPLQSHMENTVTAADLGFDESEMYVDHGDGNPGYLQSQPTRALWLGNVPPSTPSAALLAMFSPFGSIESARVLTHKSCAFVNFDQLESAVVARGTFNGKELFPGVGPIRIGFAKVPAANATNSPEPYMSLDANTTQEDTAKPPPIARIAEELQSFLTQFDVSASDLEAAKKLIASSIEHSRVYKDIPLAADPNASRKFDAPRLRELRKRIDNGACTTAELEEIAIEMLDEVAELSSDYLGNTVVQKLFELCSTPTKIKMLERVGPALAETGIHKNGTWAAQKIIDVAETAEEKWLIVNAIRPYVPALFLDQFGNYVVQCCLKFGPAYNSFIFEAMLSHTWEIAQGRFGSRAMRACLESHGTTKVQHKLLAAAITLHSVQLATNTNGGLLLTWLLDTCTLPNRFTVLATKLAQHMNVLGVHKLASMNILKIMTQRQETEAREILLKALFLADEGAVLEEVVKDALCGPGFVYKMLSTPYLDPDLRGKAVAQARQVLQKLKLPATGNNKRLMDEVGLSTRSGGGGGGGNSGDSNHARNHHASQQYQQQLYSQGGYQTHPRTAHIDQATLRALGELSLQGSAYGSPMQTLTPLQYQAMMQQGLRMSPGPFVGAGGYTGAHAQAAAAAQVGAYGGDGYYQPMYGNGYPPVMPQQGRRRQ